MGVMGPGEEEREDEELVGEGGGEYEEGCPHA
jgi:hypothetical protein